MSGSVDRIAGIIAEYNAQGVHRTGTSVDLASAAWMKSRIDELGLTSEEDRFSFERVACEAKLQGKRLVLAERAFLAATTATLPMERDARSSLPSTLKGRRVQILRPVPWGPDPRQIVRQIMK